MSAAKQCDLRMLCKRAGCIILKQYNSLAGCLVGCLVRLLYDFIYRKLVNFFLLIVFCNPLDCSKYTFACLIDLLL